MGLPAGMLSGALRRSAGVRVFRGLHSTAPTAAKATTNLVGLAVEPNAPAILKDLYAKTLEDLKAIPSSAEYRINVEKITNYRLKVVEAGPDIDSIEAEVGVQVEEMIVEAKDELSLIPQMTEWAPWD